MMTPDEKKPEREPRIIDFAARRRVHQTRKRNKRLLIIAAIAAVLLLVGVVLWSQISAVLGGQDFWSNFAAAAWQ